MGNDPVSHWPRLCGRKYAPRPCRREESDLFLEDPAGVLAEVVLEMLHHLRTLNHHLGVILQMDSITGNTQTPEQKQQRHTDNVRTIQDSITNQIRDLNAGLETIQQQHPTLDMTGLFMSVHQLDSNHRALLDLAKEAAGVNSDDVPAPPRLIDVTSSNDPNKAGGAPPQMFTHIDISDTDQPRPDVTRKPSPDLAPATEATQPGGNTIAVNPGSAPA
jgi:hypothetical protein